MEEEHPRPFGKDVDPRFKSLNDVYSYKNLRTLTLTEGIVEDSYPYWAYYIGPRDAFIYFTLARHKIESDYGWKFHLSVDDEDFKNVEKAWDILKDILIKHNIKVTKVVKPDVQISIKAPNQRGKQITIYQFYNADLKWEEILTEITTEFCRNKIIPGHAPISDHPIRGTPFAYYRTDADAEGKPLKGGRDGPGEPNPIFNAFNIMLQPKKGETLVLPIVKPWNEQPAFKLK